MHWIFYDAQNKRTIPLPLNVVAERSTLSIYLINSGNQGRYECKGTTEENHRWSFSKASFAANAILTIVDSLEPSHVIPGKIIVNVGKYGWS